MARLNRRFDWLIIEKMTPTGTFTADDGRHFAEFNMDVRVRRWHPGYWVALARAIFRRDES